MNGFDKMYKIKQNNGEDYIVNSKHTLLLKVKNQKIRINNDKCKILLFN